MCIHGEVYLSPVVCRLRGDIGRLGKVTVLTHISEEYPAIAVAGLGKKNANFSDVEYLDEEAENIRIATGVGARELIKVGVKEVPMTSFNINVRIFLDEGYDTMFTLNRGKSKVFCLWEETFSHTHVLNISWPLASFSITGEILSV